MASWDGDVWVDESEFEHPDSPERSECEEGASGPVGAWTSASPDVAVRQQDAILRTCPRLSFFPLGQRRGPGLSEAQVRKQNSCSGRKRHLRGWERGPGLYMSLSDRRNVWGRLEDNELGLLIWQSVAVSQDLTSQQAYLGVIQML